VHLFHRWTNKLPHGFAIAGLPSFFNGVVRFFHLFVEVFAGLFLGLFELAGEFVDLLLLLRRELEFAFDAGRK
jgi:hypothetical protein